MTTYKIQELEQAAKSAMNDWDGQIEKVCHHGMPILQIQHIPTPRHIALTNPETILSWAERDRKMMEALIKIRDCDFVISLPDRMDAVREIARYGLSPTTKEPK